MALTRLQLAQMKEDQLQKEVLIPLFRAMGYRDVHLYQGNTELGKDIVMWKSGDLGERVNYAVVAKAKKVTGRAVGNSSAAEVKFQIEQALTSSWLDQTTTEKHDVERCFVVCSKEINNEAITAIKGALENTNLDRVTRFIDGDELWTDYIQKYMPERAVIDNLQELQKLFDDVSPHYRIVATTKGEFSIEPKYPGAEKEHPIGGMAKFSFPDTEEGRKAREEFERHLATGQPVTISSPYIEEFTIPDILLPFIQPSTERMQLKLGPREWPRPFLIKLIIEHIDGTSVTMEYIHLEGIGGDEEVTFKNENQPVPWKFEIIFDYKNRHFNLTYNFNAVGLNVYQALKAYRFMQALSKGGRLLIESIDNGVSCPITDIAQGVYPLPDEDWMELLEKLVAIQSSTTILLALPESDIITAKVADKIFHTAQIIETGQVIFAPQEIKMPADLNLATNFLKYFGDGKPQSITMRYKDAASANIFGVDIPLGPAIMTCDAAYISTEDLTVLKEAISIATEDSTITICLKMAEGSTLQGLYPKWLSDDDPYKQFCNRIPEQAD